MDTLLDIRTGVYYDINAGTESTLYPQAVVDDAINQAYRKIGGLHRWNGTNGAKRTTTQLNINYYDYPASWRPNSIWKLMVNAEDYGDPITFKDFLYETENSIPSGKDYFWANQDDRFFIYPTPTSAGLNIDIWGQGNITALTADANETIFTNPLPEVNDAIRKEAVAILKHPKGQDASSHTLLSAEALVIVESAWATVKQNTSKAEMTRGGWNTPDYFRVKPTKDNNIGDFE